VLQVFIKEADQAGDVAGSKLSQLSLKQTEDSHWSARKLALENPSDWLEKARKWDVAPRSAATAKGVE
jgi:hypothetical protein